MKRLTLAFYVIMSISQLMAAGADRLNPHSRRIYDELHLDTSAAAERLRTHTLSSSGEGTLQVQAFVTVSSASVLDSLRSMGVSIGAVAGNIATATIPPDILDAVIGHEGVVNFTFARRMGKRNDVSRQLTGVDRVHRGEGMEGNYTGAGVIYGIVDIGIDFNHYAFRNPDGSSRMLYAYLPDVAVQQGGGVQYQGRHVNDNFEMVETSSFPGLAYPSDAVSNLTSGTRSESHGTHTTAIGAGGRAGSDLYYGMAPDADIIATDCELSDVSIINGVALAMDEAERRGQPCVVNLSLGSNIGSHDGCDPYTRMLTAFTGPGRVIVMASGNEGNCDLYLCKPRGEIVTTALYGASYRSISYGSIVDMWGRTGRDFSVTVSVYDLGTQAFTDLGSFRASDAPSAFITDDTHFSGKLAVYGGYDLDSRKYNLYTYVSSNITMKSSNYILCLTLGGDETVDVWTDTDIELGTGGISGAVAGSPDGSYNSGCCSPDIISVGAYTSRQTYPCVNGKTYALQYGDLDDIAPYSSYGTDPNGMSHPDVTAPGMVVVSAVSSYDGYYKSDISSDYELVSNDIKDGREQRYAILYGTSMASPCLAGIVALWLQACPDLTAADIREVLRETSAQDSYTRKSALRFGAGKVDALAGIRYILQHTAVEDMDAEHGARPLITNISDGVLEVTLPQSAHNASIEVYGISGNCIARRAAQPGSTSRILLPSQLQGSVCIVSVRTDDSACSQKFVVR